MHLVGNDATRRYRRDHLRYALGGAGLMTVLFALTAAILALFAVWYDGLKARDEAYAGVSKAHEFLSRLDDETRAALGGDAAAVGTASAATDAALRDASLLAANRDIAASLSNYRASPTSVARLARHADIVELTTSSMYQSVRTKFSSRLRKSLDIGARRLVTLQEQRVADLVAAAEHIGSYFSGSFLHRIAVAASTTSALQTFVAVDTSDDIATRAATRIIDAVRLRSGSGSLPPIQVSSMQLNQTLRLTTSAAIPVTLDPSRSTLTTVIVFGIACALALLGGVLSKFVTFRYIRSTRRARSLVESFGTPEVSRQIIGAYRPVLEHLKVASASRNFPKNEVSREYHTAASFVQTLRPLLPQALFGELGVAHMRQPNGAWSLNAQPVRLEMGMSFSRCTIMTVFLAFARAGNFTLEAQGAKGLMRDVSTALALIVKEANDAGGILLSVSPGGVVTCAWNATNIVPDAALQALRTARRIDSLFAGVKVDLNLSTGNCIVANTKIGDRKHVTMVGAPFEISERLLLLNEAHDARLIVDYETFKELPRETQRQCKPVVVLKIREESAVVYSADVQRDWSIAQWKAYSSAFTLYQNNMITESVQEFRKYLAQYPGDSSAMFLLNSVLQNRVGTKRRSTTARSGMAGGSGNPMHDANPLA